MESIQLTRIIRSDKMKNFSVALLTTVIVMDVIRESCCESDFVGFKNLGNYRELNEKTFN